MASKSAAVRRDLLKKKKPPEAVAALQDVCRTAAQSPEVKASQAAASALGELSLITDATGTSLQLVLDKAQELRAARKALRRNLTKSRVKLVAYEALVDSLAEGDAAVIARAGLPSRARKPPSPALEKVASVTPKPGRQPGEGIISWPPAPGATTYAIEVNLAPENPASTYTAIAPGSSRRRTVKGPSPGSKILARVAAVASDGTMSAWSDPVLVTTR
jgi:hypothetical protein